MRVIVNARWDAESGTWTATSPDVPGLVTGAASEDELEEKLVTLVPACFHAAGQAVEDNRLEIRIRFHGRSDRCG